MHDQLAILEGGLELVVPSNSVVGISRPVGVVFPCVTPASGYSRRDHDETCSDREEA